MDASRVIESSWSECIRVLVVEWVREASSEYGIVFRLGLHRLNSEPAITAPL